MAADPKIVDQVLGKLTQLRMELAADGRAVLDAMIVGRVDAEVIGHALAGEAADPGAADPGAAVSGRAIDLVGEEYRAVDF